MTLDSIKAALVNDSIFHAEGKMLSLPSVVGYEKIFKWKWFATQMNTFIVATDFGESEITTSIIEEHLEDAYQYADQNYTGWRKGMQSGLAVISVLISSNIDEAAKEYCIKSKAGKKWGGFTVPVIYNSQTDELFSFKRNPMWGRIYYPHFKKLIKNLNN